MTITEAIKLAIKGGWNPKGHNFSDRPPSHKVQAIDKAVFKERFFLDPLFWQALGKSLGWTELIDEYGIRKKDIRGSKSDIERSWNRMGRTKKLEWLYHWHSFIDHLADGKTIEDFFKELT